MNLVLAFREEDNLHGAFRKDGGGRAERLAPHRIVEFGTGRGHGLHAGLDNCPRAVGAGKVCRHQCAAVGRDPATRGFEDGGTLSVFEPDEPVVADNALGEVSDTSREGIARRAAP